MEAGGAHGRADESSDEIRQHSTFTITYRKTNKQHQHFEGMTGDRHKSFIFTSLPL